MPAEEKRILKTHNLKKIAIIAGGGDLPAMVAGRCIEQGISPFIIGYKDRTSLSLLEKYPHMIARLGGAGSVVKRLKREGISDLVMIGSMPRPTLAELRPDLTTLRFYTRMGLEMSKTIGDDGFLGYLRKFLEDLGFQIHGAQMFLQSCIAPQGMIGSICPDERQMQDVLFGFEKSQALGAADIGQSVIIANGELLGEEGVEGTDALIKKVAAQHPEKIKGAILVKTCKPQQDKDLDLPTIGEETLLLAANYELSGVAVHAGNSFIVNKETVAQIADTHKMFIIGVDSDTF